MNINNIDYRSKYLKYKSKYLLLKELEGGDVDDTEAPKYSKEIMNAASAINLRELLSLKPFIEQLDVMAQANKQVAKAELREAKEAASTIADAATAVQRAVDTKNPEDVKAALEAAKDLKTPKEFRSFTEEAARPKKNLSDKDKLDLIAKVKQGKQSSKKARNIYVQENKEKGDQVRKDRDEKRKARNESESDSDEATNMFRSLSLSDSDMRTSSPTKPQQKLGVKTESLPPSKKSNLKSD
jgi:hypothetical protein